jgi:hypothetical protein
MDNHGERVNGPLVEQEGHLEKVNENLGTQHPAKLDMPLTTGFAHILPPHSYSRVNMMRTEICGKDLLKCGKSRTSAFELVEEICDDFAKG